MIDEHMEAKDCFFFNFPAVHGNMVPVRSMLFSTPTYWTIHLGSKTSRSGYSKMIL
jgi:hypothetical protein